MRYPNRKLITAPSTDAFDFDALKFALRVDNDADDAMLRIAGQAAVGVIEEEIGRALITQTWECYSPCWPKYRFLLPLPPLQSVTSITYRLADGSEVVLDPSTYVVDSVNEPGRIFLADGQAWPSASLYTVNPIVVRFVCGYGAVADLPAAITRAIYWQAQHNYDYRNAVMVGPGIAAKVLERGLLNILVNWKVRLADEFSNQ